MRLLVLISLGLIAQLCLLIFLSRMIRFHRREVAEYTTTIRQLAASERLLRGELDQYRYVVRQIAMDAGIEPHELMQRFDTSDPKAFVLQPKALRLLLADWLENREHRTTSEQETSTTMAGHLRQPSRYFG